MPFQEAVDTLDLRSIIGSTMNSAEWSAVPVGLHNRAYFSSKVASVRVLQRSRDDIRDFLTSARGVNEKGETFLKSGSRQAFVKRMQDLAIAEGMGPLVPEDAGTVRDFTSQTRQELIWDTQVRQAYDQGDWMQGQDEAVLNEFPGQELIRDIPVKEPRHDHAQYEGVVKLKTDIAYWKRINQDFGVAWGPWGWGCGHGVRDVDRAECERLGLIAPGTQLKPVVEDFNAQLQASTENLDPDMQALLKTALGNQVRIRDGVARWVTNQGNSTADLPPGAGQPEPAAAPAPTPSPVDAPAGPSTASPASIPVRVNPVSDGAKLGTTLTDIGKQAVQHALRQIDRVHDDGKLPPILIRRLPAKASHTKQGQYIHGGAAIELRQQNARRPELTAVHEIGHWIDELALPGSGFSSGDSPALAEWRKAVLGTQAVRNLSDNPHYAAKPKHRKYLLRPRELWARSYAQYVATKSNDPAMLAQIAAIRDGTSGSWVDSHWSDSDFGPVREAIDKLFATLKWL